MKIAAIIITILLLVQVGAAREAFGLTGPDGFFYPLKIWIEKLSLGLVFNQTEKAQKMLDLADERLKEAEEMENGSEAFEKAMDEYTDQLQEFQDFIINGSENRTRNISVNIKQKIEDHANRTKAYESAGRISVIQQNIIEASSSAGENRIKVSVIDGDVSADTEGGNATVTRDGNNVTVVSIGNNSRQVVIIKSSGNTSSSSSSIVVRSSSSTVSND